MTRATEEPVVRVAGTGADGGLPDAADAGGEVIAAGPTGLPAVEPLLTATRGGRTAFYPGCSPERLATVAAAVHESGEVDAADPAAVADHDPGTARLPAADLPGLDAGDRAVLGACGWRRPADPADHEAAGGFARADAAAVFDLGGALRGRGWGDSCHDEVLGGTWEAVRDADGEAAVVINAHGNPADALLLSGAPFEALEGAAALARAVGADRVVVYASADDERAVGTVREAVGNYPEPPVEFDVVTGPGAYRAAEPSMAVEAVEGNHRLEARLRPPGLEAVGLHGRPTLVHTPRTLARLAVALREGAVPDTRVVTVTGDVADRATVEVPASATLGDALGAVEVAGEFKAAAVGGRFGGLTRDRGVGLAPDALAAADLGTEGVVRVLTADRCVVEFVGRRARFAAEENCGRCVPCREGSTQLADLLRDVYAGEFDPAGIEELVGVMESSSICAFGVQAGRPARTALAEFETEFEAHAAGRCPAGSCSDALEA